MTRVFGLVAAVAGAGIALATFARAQNEALDDLIERSNALTSFTARYELRLTSSKGEAQEATDVRIDYVAPGRVRVEARSKEADITYACVDGVYALAAKTEQPAYARVEWAAVRAQFAGAEQAFAAEYPAAAEKRGSTGAIVSMRWWFDDKTDKANFNFDAIWSEERTVALGWLATLRSKGTPLTREGELFTFTTDDGSFRGALSAANGFLVDLAGASPNGEMKIHLAELELGQAIDDARFAVPTAPPGARDISADIERSFVGGLLRQLRSRIYRAVAGRGAGEWSADERARVERTLRAFHTSAIAHAVGPRLADAAKKRDGTVAHIQSQAATKTPDELEAMRERERGYLREYLAEMRAGFETRLVEPEGAAELTGAAELLALERGVMLAVFDATVREPLIADFERALDAARD